MPCLRRPQRSRITVWREHTHQQKGIRDRNDGKQDHQTFYEESTCQGGVQNSLSSTRHHHEVTYYTFLASVPPLALLVASPVSPNVKATPDIL